MVIKRIFRHSLNPPQYDTSDDECDDGDTNCELCASMNCPSFSPRHYAKLKNETYDDWQKTAIIAMETAAVRERNAAIAEGRVKNGIAC
ncbi:unnamed protein product [Parnassius apollo]|uniref:(apollo) hypothetical protein n=1 Tax=Parnassius apollo TaxID=110799 RepID=A0A8S3WSE2_PARAO|nr:unnamed protein product [Parnassius apollo]